jgi:hypothetical protein
LRFLTPFCHRYRATHSNRYLAPIAPSVPVTPSRPRHRIGLTGHYVNYRKQVSPSVQELLPEEAFRLYAVCARFPHNLPSLVPWQELQPGVFECRRGTDAIRVVVLRQLPQSEHNSLWHLFSAVPQLVESGRRHQRLRSTENSSLLRRLFEGYRQEGLAMPYTIEDFRRNYVKEHLEDLPPELRREDLTPSRYVGSWRRKTY